ncbi:MAG TPA: glycosyltransferase [Thermoguttaceae bacterium]|nr:glycosyltransferase [Thermoguttaceae bacterium]
MTIGKPMVEKNALSTQYLPKLGSGLHVHESLLPLRTDRKSTASQPIKVLHVLGRVGFGGTEVGLVRVFRQIDRQRYRFHFCALSGRGGELEDEVRALGGEVHRMRRGKRGFARRFTDLLERERFDAVHASVLYTSGYLLRLAARCGVPVRVALFAASRPDRVRGLMRKVYRRLMSLWDDRYAGQRVMRGWIDRHATHILGVSRWSLASAWRTDWQSDPRCTVVYDGLDPAEFELPSDRRGVRREFGVPDAGPLYLHVGRMAEEKNHVRLIEIFSEVLRLQPAASLLLVGRTTVNRGDDSVLRRVRQRLERLGCAGRVVFAGERTDVPRLMKAADAFVFPSLCEGLGDVVLEASAAGTPALCTDLACIREIADRLPGVCCLSLDESDAAWARQAEAMSRTTPSHQRREAALAAFRRSVFHIRHRTDALCRIWQGSSLETAAKETADG